MVVVGVRTGVIPPADLRKISALGLDLGPIATPTEVYSVLGIAWSTYNDVADIDLTYVYAEMTYTDDLLRVTSGRNPYWECYAAPDGWSPQSCYGDWSPTGPSQVWTKTGGNFQYLGGTWPHWHEAQYFGTPGLRYDVYCPHSGSTVPGGFWKCSGGPYY